MICWKTGSYNISDDNRLIWGFVLLSEILQAQLCPFGNVTGGEPFVLYGNCTTMERLIQQVRIEVCDGECGLLLLGLGVARLGNKAQVCQSPCASELESTLELLQKRQHPFQMKMALSSSLERAAWIFLKCKRGNLYWERDKKEGRSYE